MELKNIFNNEEAVSPIVATLVLVVVAIAGAAAVGGIMDNLSNDVGSDTTGATDDIANSNELLIRGSTTVQPVSEALADTYMRQHPNLKINVMGTGSGDGVQSTGLELCDIGAASRPVKDSEQDTYPDVRTHQIGASAVVVITSKDVNTTGYNFTTEAIYEVYNKSDNEQVNIVLTDATVEASDVAAPGTGTGEDVTVVQRFESSGTEDTFAEAIGFDDNLDETGAKGATGNAGVAAEVAQSGKYIGFVDFAFVTDNHVVNGVECDASEVTESNLKAAITGGSSPYPADLTRPLNYLTLGNPNPEVQDFLDFAQANTEESLKAFHDAGYWSSAEL